jgi:hypothetical protein
MRLQRGRNYLSGELFVRRFVTALRFGILCQRVELIREKPSRYRGHPPTRARLPPAEAGLPAAGNIPNHGESAWRFAFRGLLKVIDLSAIRRRRSSPLEARFVVASTPTVHMVR